MKVVIPWVGWWEALADFGRPLQAVLDEVKAPPGEVWFGAHVDTVQPPAGAILFQTEVRGSRWFTPQYLRKLARAPAVWDYSTENRGAYECRAWHHVPLRYHETQEWPKWTRRDRPDIPIGFFGSLNPRRMKLLAGAEWMPVQFGQARVDWLARVGAVVVPHYYESGPVEQARIGMLLANAIPVVAELAPDQEDYPGPLYAPGDELVALARSLTVEDGEQQRARYKTNGGAHAAVRAALGLEGKRTP